MRKMILMAAMMLVAAMSYGQSSGPVNTPMLNKAYYFVGVSPYSSVQAAVTKACAATVGGSVVIAPGVTPSDTIAAVTGGCNKVWIRDQRAVAEACYSWQGTAYVIANCQSSGFNVRDFGAKGNGVTDDTAAINSAMNACANAPFPFNGCNLYFPSGIYMTSGLTLQSYVHITGDGWATSVIQLLPGHASDVLTVPVSTFNFSIYGVTIDGNSGKGGTGSCLMVQTSPVGPNAINTANKQTASINAYKMGYIYGDMFSNCSNSGIYLNVYNFALFFDNFYVYNNGQYGIFTQATDDIFTNFVTEHNGTAGIKVINSNNKFSNAKVIWNGYANKTEAAIYSGAFNNVFIDIEAQDNYVSGFFDGGGDNQFIGCMADTNGYTDETLVASSHTASGFVIGGTNSVYSGNKVTDYRGRLADGFYATEWPYTITNPPQSEIGISYDKTNKEPPVVAGDIIVVNNVATLPPEHIATSTATNADSKSLDFRGSYWNGTAATFSDWLITNHLHDGLDELAFTPPVPGTNPGTPQIIFPQLAFGSASAGNFPSVQFRLQSSVWNGSATTFPGWSLQSTVGAGTNPDLVLSLLPYNVTGTPTYQINSNMNVTGNFSALESSALGQHITNTPAFQVASAPVCAIAEGSPALSFCEITFTLSVTEPDMNYVVAGCALNGSSVGVVGNIAPTSTSSFKANLFSLLPSVTNTGTVQCLVVH